MFSTILNIIITIVMIILNLLAAIGLAALISLLVPLYHRKTGRLIPKEFNNFFYTLLGILVSMLLYHC